MPRPAAISATSASARSSSAESSAIAAWRESTSVRRSAVTLQVSAPRRLTCSMCGRYTLVTADHQQLAQRFGAMMPEEGGLERYNVAPTEQAVAVVNGKSGGREAHLLRWSLVPGYAKDLKGPPMFNARVETVATKAPFK